MAFFSEASRHQFARNQRIVFIGRAVRCVPVVELIRGDTQTGDEALSGNLGRLDQWLA